jgi:DnaJ-class molecular chaperone
VNIQDVEDDGFVTVHCTGCKSMIEVEVVKPDDCVNCNGGGIVNPSRTHGFGYDLQDDKDCPVCDGTGSIPSEHGPKYPYRCPECCGGGES